MLTRREKQVVSRKEGGKSWSGREKLESAKINETSLEFWTELQIAPDGRERRKVSLWGF
jgi:hypothetical protein